MVQQISEGVSVTVVTFFQETQSNPIKQEFLFAYRITIKNLSVMPLQLLRRHWYIFDSDGTQREVIGEGVVGQQPVIEPGEHYQYISGCNLRTEMGKMHGCYHMRNLYTKEDVTVCIPEFQMIVPMKLN